MFVTEPSVVIYYCSELQAHHVGILEWSGSSNDIALECAL